MRSEFYGCRCGTRGEIVSRSRPPAVRSRRRIARRNRDADAAASDPDLAEEVPAVLISRWDEESDRELDPPDACYLLILDR